MLQVDLSPKDRRSPFHLNSNATAQTNNGLHSLAQKPGTGHADRQNGLTRTMVDPVLFSFLSRNAFQGDEMLVVLSRKVVG